MNSGPIIDRLDAFAATLPAAVGGLSAVDARFRPPSGAWSVIEIVGHLVDEEVEDFRARLELTLRDNTVPWPSIDPVRAARERGYQERDLAESVRRFVAERRRSIEWLRTLNQPDWSLAYHHPKFGPQTAGMLLGAWAAHDALHLRQIAKRLYELAARDADPYPVGYAGEWGP